MKERRAWIGVPADWAVEARDHVGPFVTREVYRLPDGSVRRWTSRRHRKVRGGGGARGWWMPRALGWWIAVLFMVGSVLFGLGSFPPYADAMDPRVVGLTYFVGSLFFTSAGYLQFAQVVNAPTRVGGGGDRWRFLGWQPDRIDWWSASVQSVGTLLFNVSTFAALDAALSLQHQERLVWAPDMFGSICFMIASSLAWVEVCHRWWAWRARDISWWIVALNLGGSIAFQLSAIAAFIRPATGTYANLPLANLGTFVGAVGFFFGALLLIPEMDASEEGSALSVRGASG